MPAAGFALGVDLGTSNTVAVLRWPDGRTKPLLFDGSPLLPSAVYAEPGSHGRPGSGPNATGGLLTGRDAVHTARVDPARFEPNPKRRIDEGTVLLGDREVPVVDMLAAVLRRVWIETTRITGGLPTSETTLTCPASWAAQRRQLLASAAQQAGMPPVRIVEEPVAAATYFASVLGRQVPIGSVVVVHDFGAGTFDASVVARHAVGFEVLAVDGRGDLGGLDIDAQIVGHFAQQYRGLDEAAWQRLTEPTTLEDRRHRRLLWEDACAVKEQLSRSNAADLVIPLVNVDAHLTRSELEALAEPLLQRTVEVTQGAIRWAKLAEGRVAGLFLVGGSSRIPLLATLLHRSLGYPPEVLEQPELVVAEGALFAAAVPPTSPSATVMWKLPPPAVPLLPTSGAPVSGGAPGPSPVSVPPAPGVVSGVPGVVSGAPAAPASPAPAPGSPAPTPVGFQSGRAVVPDARPARTPRPPSVVNPTRALPSVTSPPAPGYGPYAPPVHVSAPPAPEPVWTGGAVHPQPSGRAGRIIGRLVTVLVLLATPLVAAYIAYQITTDQPLWPILITY